MWLNQAICKQLKKLNKKVAYLQTLYLCGFADFFISIFVSVALVPSAEYEIPTISELKYKNTLRIVNHPPSDVSAVGGGCIVLGGAVAASYEKQTKNKTKQMFFVVLVRRISSGQIIVRLRSDLKGVGCGVGIWVSVPQGTHFVAHPLYKKAARCSCRCRSCIFILLSPHIALQVYKMSCVLFQVYSLLLLL